MCCTYMAPFTRYAGGKTYTIPGGLRFGNSSTATALNRSWSKPATGEVHAFQGGAWGSWMFPISKRVDNADGSGNITWVGNRWKPNTS